MEQNLVQGFTDQQCAEADAIVTTLFKNWDDCRRFTIRVSMVTFRDLSIPLVNMLDDPNEIGEETPEERDAVSRLERIIGVVPTGSVEGWLDIANGALGLNVDAGAVIDDRLASRIGNEILRRSKLSQVERPEWTDWVLTKVAKGWFEIGRTAWTTLAKAGRSSGKMQTRKRGTEVKIHRSVFDSRGKKFPLDDD